MRRRRTIISLPGLILMALLLAALGFFLWRQGGLAFSPGSLSSQGKPEHSLEGFNSHADFEKECRRCHQPLRAVQAQLCLSCHDGVASEILNRQGLHSHISEVVRCYQCHSDHRGRDFSPLADALHKFDHSITEFSLIWHQVDYSLKPMECSACHVDPVDYSVPLRACTDCHGAQNATFMANHTSDFGANCLECHDGRDRMLGFDHSQTAFPLSGKHQETRCTACHTHGRFKGIPADCVDCHQEPTRHAGLFSLDCASCHTSASWSPALLDEQQFDHANQAGFSLTRHQTDYENAPVTCTTCHPDSLSEFEIDICIDCHTRQDRTFMDAHVLQFGAACLDCHDGVDRMSDFDHNQFFVLDGRHAEIECVSCHQDNLWRGLSGECVSCHAEPEIHAGFFGLQCGLCHTTLAWSPAQLQSHAFPLDHGGEGEIACQTCHPSVYADYTCYGCHEHQPEKIESEHLEEGVSLEELPNCVECHPTGREGEARREG